MVKEVIRSRKCLSFFYLRLLIASLAIVCMSFYLRLLITSLAIVCNVLLLFTASDYLFGHRMYVLLKDIHTMAEEVIRSRK
jgi:hypothetical protein